MRTKPVQLSVMAVAALAVFAVAAVMLLASGGSAQADTASLAPDNGGGNLSPLPQTGPPSGNPTPEPTPEGTPTPTPPRYPTPEPCPAEPASAVDSGHIALFDVWWNTEELELTNNSCPPYIEHENGEDVRKPSDINIDETVIHIPSTHKVTLTEADYPKPAYQKLWEADDKENPNGDGDRMVWALPACPTGSNLPDGELCLSFSAALLNSADWDGNIVYHVDHVHQTDIDKQDPRYVLVYDGTPGAPVLEWDSSNARRSEMPVPPGEYDRPMWFFTSRGTYQFQVHITGDPHQPTAPAPAVVGAPDPVTVDPSVNSDVREYTIHVGAEADLGVSVTATPDLESPDTTLDPGDDVTITVTASNAGPDTAPGTKVEVTLPDGLTGSTSTGTTDNPNPSTGTYDSATGVWTIGDLAVTNATNAPTLTITATVDAGTRGQTLKVKATISATETLHIKEIVRDANGNPVKEANGKYRLVDQTYPVAVPDTDTGNNMAMTTVTVPAIANLAPFFSVTRSVHETAETGDAVGAPIPAHDPDGDPLTYWLTGAGRENFVVNGAGQITTSMCDDLDYEVQRSYDLKLHASDRKDRDGNQETVRVADHHIGVHIQVTNVLNELPNYPELAFAHSEAQLRLGETTHFSVTPKNFPLCQELTYVWERATASDGPYIEVQRGTELTYSDTQSTAGTWYYRVATTYRDKAGNSHNLTSSATHVAIWK